MIPGDDLAGDVVLGGSQPAAADHRVAAFQGLAQRGFHAREVVADLDLEVRVDTGQGQLLTDPGRVGIDDLAEQQLGADGDDFAAHAGLPMLEPGSYLAPYTKECWQ